MEKAKPTLTIVVQFDDLDNLEEVKSEIEDLSGYGRVIKAELVIPSETKIDLKP